MYQRNACAFRSSKLAKLRPGQEAPFDPGEGALDATLAVAVPDAVGAELEAQRSREGGHLGRDHGVGPGAAGQHDAGVVDDAARAGAIHELRRLQQEVLGLEAVYLG